jgi:hypothetical protein
VLTILVLGPWGVAAEPEAGLMPDSGLQGEIRGAVHGLVAAGTEEQRQTAIATASGLGQRSAAGRIRLLKQLSLFLAGSAGTEDAMGGALLLRVLDFQRDEILEATLPHLVAAAPDLNKTLRELAASMPAPAGMDDPVAVVLEIEAWRTGRATGASASVPPVASPADPGRREAIGNLLGDLSGDDNRWVKAYAAAAVAADPELVSPEVRRRLQEP